jgi:outer membrane receptor for ferric coprogen and ferric-rhodotorulic acid
MSVTRYRRSLALSALASMAVECYAEVQPTTLSPVRIDALHENDDAGSYKANTVSVGSKVALPPREVPQSISVVTQARIADQNLITIGDALNEVTGVSISPWDSTTHQYYSRGYTMDMAYDGVPVYGGTSGIQEYDLSIYERVEVLRGPSALFMGSGQGGGLVNLVRKRGLDDPALNLTTSVGSWDNQRVVVDAGGRLDAQGRLRSRVVASWQQHDYFWDVSHKEKWLTYANLDYLITPNTVVSLSATHQEDHTDSPSMGLPAYSDGRFLDVSRSTHVYPDWNRFAYETTELAFDLEHAFSNGWQLKGKVLNRTQDKFWKDAFPSPNIGVDPATNTIASYNRRSSDVDFDRKAFDVYLSGPFQLLNREHMATVGYNWDRFLSHSRSVNATPYRNGVPLGNPNVVPEPDLTFTNGTENVVSQNGVYGQLRLSLTDPLTLILGARSSNFERRSRSVSPSPTTSWSTTQKETGEFTPYGGLVYAFSDKVSGYVNYSDIFMPQGQETAAGTTLEPRIGAQWETGLKATFLDGNLDASAAVFRTTDKNRALSDPDNPGYSISAGEVRVEGWEMEMTGRPTPNLNLSVGYSYLTSRYVEDQTRSGEKFSLFEPRHSLKSYAKYRVLDGGLKGAFVGGGVHLSSGTDGTSNTALRSQGGYALVNGQLGYEWSEKTSLALIGSNLLDRHYYARVGNLNTYNTYGEPRSFTLVLRTSL